MEVTGDLLTQKQRDAICAPFLKNSGREWNLHDMAEYMKDAYDKVEKDAETTSILTDGLLALRQGRANDRT